MPEYRDSITIAIEALKQGWGFWTRVYLLPVGSVESYAAGDGEAWVRVVEQRTLGDIEWSRRFTATEGGVKGVALFNGGERYKAARWNIEAFRTLTGQGKGLTVVTREDGTYTKEAVYTPAYQAAPPSPLPPWDNPSVDDLKARVLTALPWEGRDWSGNPILPPGPPNPKLELLRNLGVSL